MSRVHTVGLIQTTLPSDIVSDMSDSSAGSPKKAFGSPAADQVLSVLDLLSRERGPIPASTIARSLGLPRSTVYQLLRVMVARGFAVHVAEKGRYGLGLRAFELSSGYARQQPLVMLGTPILRKLVSDTGHSGHLAVLHGTDVIYLVEERTARGPWLVSDVGVRLPAHLTATGRALLAALPVAQFRALYPDSRYALPRRGGQGPETVRELRQIIQTTRQRGFATEDDEVTEGFSSVAAAVTDHSGWPVASLALTAPGSVLWQEERHQIADLVNQAARTLARRLG